MANKTRTWKLISAIAFSGAIVLGAAGCGGGGSSSSGSGPVIVDPPPEIPIVPADDHGDSRADATVLALDGSLAGEITDGDEDYFRVDVTETGTLTIYTTGNLNTVGQLQDGDGTGLVIADDISGTNSNFNIDQYVYPGAYYVRVRGKTFFDALGRSYSISGDYVVHASFVADDHGDSPSYATEIALGSSVPGEIRVAGDVDYFFVRVTEPGTLTIYTTGSIDTRGELQHPDGSESYKDDGGDQNNFRLSVIVVHPGKHYIWVRAGNLETGSYALWAQFVASPPDRHGNTRADATLLPLGGSVLGEIWEEEDEDYFRVEVPRPGQLTVYVDKEDELVGEVQAADGAHVATLRYREGPGLAFARLTATLDVAPGTYYVRVGTERFRYHLRYNLWTNFVGSQPPPTDDHGDTRADATFLPLGGSVPGEIWQRDDEDFFRIEVAQTGTLTVYTTGQLVTAGELQSADGTVLASDRYRGDQLNFRIVRPVEPGMYYVKVSAPDGERTTFGTYVVLAEFGAPLHDDHGDTRADATFLPLGGSVPGEIWLDDDDDFFRIEISQRGTLTVDVENDNLSLSPVEGELQAADGAHLRDDYVGHFGIERDLDPGTYFVKVSAYIPNPGSPETYVVHARFDATAPDDHGDTRFDATSLALGSSVSGVAEATVDEDFFRVEVPQAGWLTVYTTGDADTYGELLSADGALLERSDDARFADDNFRMEHSVGPGTYYVKVKVHTTVVLEGGRFPIRIHSSHASYTVFANVFAGGAPDDHGDSRADATSLALGGSVSGAIEEGDDVDFFKVELTARGDLKVYTTGILSTEGELISADGTLVWSDRPVNRNFNIDRSVGQGTYYVKVESRGAALGSYAVHARFDESYPDDHGDWRANATSLALGGSAPGELEYNRDEDFFRVEVTQPGTLTVYTTGDANPFGRLQDPDGNALAFDHGSDMGSNFRIVEVVDPGPHYIKVSGDGRSQGSYVVHTNFVAGPADDHGNSRFDATALPLGGSVSGVIEERDDGDYFRVEVTEPGTLVAYTTGNDDPSGVLQASDGSFLSSNDDSGEGRNFRIVSFVVSATYYIRVGGASGSYVVHADFVAQAPDDHGDSQADATVLALGSSMPGGIQYGGDSDYFSIEVTEAGSLVVYTSESLNTVGELQTADGSVLASYTGIRNWRLWRYVAPATYYIRVGGSNMGRPGSYVVHADFVAQAPDVHGDIRADATVLALGSSVPGGIQYVRDSDYFSVEVTELGTLTVYTSGSIDTVGQLQTASGFVLTKNDDGGDRRNFRIGRHLDPATYYIWVGGSEPGSYVVHAEFVPDAPALPPDPSDTPEDAPTVVTDQMVEGHMHSSEDVDYFRFEVPEPGIYQFTLDSEIPGLEISLQDENGNILASDRTESLVVLLAALKAQAIYLVVTCSANPLCVAAVIDLLGGILDPDYSNIVTGLKYALQVAKLTLVAISEELKIRSDAPFVGDCRCAAIVEPGGASKEIDFADFIRTASGRRPIVELVDQDPGFDVNLNPDTGHAVISAPAGANLGIRVFTVRASDSFIDQGQVIPIGAKEFNVKVNVSAVPRILPGAGLSVTVEPGSEASLNLRNVIGPPDNVGGNPQIIFELQSVRGPVDSTFPSAQVDPPSNLLIQASGEVEGEFSIALEARFPNAEGTLEFTIDVSVGLGPEWVKAANVDCYAHVDSLSRLMLWRDEEHAPFTYSGGCTDGKLNGQGTASNKLTFGARLTGPRFVDVRYEGDWREGMATGQGIWNASGSIALGTPPYYLDAPHEPISYEGGFVNGARHGQGGATYRFDRLYNIDMFSERGSSIYTYFPETEYVGEWLDGHRHGQGTWTATEFGVRDYYHLEGEWMNDLHWNVRGFVNSLPTHRICGDQYEGEWREGRFCEGEVIDIHDTICTQVTYRTFRNCEEVN